MTTMREILAEVASRTGVDERELVSPNRCRVVAQARAEAMHLMRLAGRSTTQIGRFLNRDHSTVAVMSNRHAARMQDGA